MSKRTHILLTMLLVAMLALGACGGGKTKEAEPPAQEAAPLAQEEIAPTEAPAEEAPAEEAVAEEAAPAEEAAAEEEAPAEETAVDPVVAGFDEYLSSIPDGYMAVTTVEDVQAAMDNGALMIDVREPSEYAEGHIPGAVNIPLRTLAQNLDKVPTDRQAILYCMTGHRAGMGLGSLAALGYDNARSFPASWVGWTGADGEVSTDAVEGESYDLPEIDADMLAAVDEFLSNIPDGWLAIKAADAVVEAVDNGAALVDVRTPDEYAEGYILDATNVPLRTLAQNLDQIPADQPVIVYCSSGHRAALATAALQSMGRTNVKSYGPSYKGWLAAQEEAGEAEPVAASEEITATEEMTATEEVSTTEGVPAEVEEAMDSDFSVAAAVDEYFSNIPEGYQAVGDIDVFKDMMENGNIYLVDVRTPDEYAEGHIPGAVNVPLRTIADNLDQIPTDQSVMVYCSSGHRAAMSLASLDMLGYTNVKSFPPGWKGWSAAEEEVSTEAVEPGGFEAPEVHPEMLAAVAEFLTNIPEGYYALGTAEQLQGAIDAGAELIDVRQPEEFADGAIPDAVNIPIRELGKHLDEIATDNTVVVYCGTGHRAAMSLAGLQVAGLNNVRSFPPSYKGWVAANE